MQSGKVPDGSTKHPPEDPLFDAVGHVDIGFPKDRLNGRPLAQRKTVNN